MRRRRAGRLSVLPRLICPALFICLVGCGSSSPSSTSQDASPSDVLEHEAGPSGDILDVETDPFDFQRCVPTCEDLACGSDGCGGNCGVCGSEESCEAGQCEIVCLAQAGTACVGDAVTSVDSCGALEEILETCSTGTQCSEGACVPCVANAARTCVEGAVHWRDSCGNPGAFERDCADAELCVGGECVPGNSPLSGQYLLTTSPEVQELAHSAGTLSLSLNTNPVECLINGAGEVSWTFMLNEGPALYLGQHDADQFTVAGETTEMIGGVSVVRKAWIQALFLDEEHFAGTWTEMVFVGSEEAAPTQVIWELSGERIP